LTEHWDRTSKPSKTIFLSYLHTLQFYFLLSISGDTLYLEIAVFYCIGCKLVNNVKHETGY